VNAAMNTRSVRRSSKAPIPSSTTRPFSEMNSADLTARHNPTMTREYPVQGHDIACSSRSTSPDKAGSSTSSSFSSIMSSPLAARISIQTLTDFIPATWSFRRHNAESAASPSPDPRRLTLTMANSEHAPERGPFPVDVARNRGYVSKEKQLEKLRSRLERDGTLKLKTSVNVCCKKCDDEVVFL
jgi:hypothetical protein